MIDLDLLPYIEYKSDDGQVRRIRPSVQISEEISLSSEVTEHPVESSSNISDHNRAQPEEATVEFFFSNAVTRADIFSPPLETQQNELLVPESNFDLNTITSSSGLLATVIALGQEKKRYVANSFAPATKSRITEVFDVIQELRLKSQLVTVRTTTTVLEEMAMISAVLTRNASTGNGGNVTISFKRIRFVQSDVTLAIPLPKDARSQKKKSAGNEVPFGPPEAKAGALKRAKNKAGLSTPGSGL